MQLLATADQMQAFDRTAIGKFGIPGLILMENAGRAFVDGLAQRVAPLTGKQVTILCGKGNNGGDGYVIARHLLNRGCLVRVVLLCKRKDVLGDAKTNLDILFRIVPRWKSTLKIVQVSSLSQLNRLQEPHIVIDAIFGTGFKGKATGVPLLGIQWINRKKSFVASVDVCSGVNASTGIVEGEAVRANLTVTMGLAKLGHYVGEGRKHSGEVVVADISIPRNVLERGDVHTYRIAAEDVRASLPERPLTAHKYSVGKIFVLAGSRKFTGAPLLCAQAAMRAGAGAVILGTPKSLQPVLARRLTEVMIAPLDETPDGSLSLLACESILERVGWADVVVMGPGLSRIPETQELIQKIIPRIKKPLVLDADALFAVATNPGVLMKRAGDTILTPHTGELSAIIGQDASNIEMLRVDVARMAARKLRCSISLKGSPSVTATSHGETYVNSTGNPGMATIGSGDVLTGIIAGLLGQGMLPAEATYSGVFIHGLAGDLAASKLGQRSVMALDILNHIPDALKICDEK